MIAACHHFSTEICTTSLYSFSPEKMAISAGICIGIRAFTSRAIQNHF